MREKRREPEVPEERVPVAERLDGSARVTSKELAPIRSVKSGILQNACSTSPRMDADLEKSALMRIARLMNSPAIGQKIMVTKSAVAMLKSTRQSGCVFQDIFRKSSNIRKPIRRVQFTKAVVRHTKIRDKNPSLGMICPGDPHQRNSNAPKFEDRSQEKTGWQERCAREAAGRLANIFQKIKEKNKNSILLTFGKLVPASAVNPKTKGKRIC